MEKTAYDIVVDEVCEILNISADSITEHSRFIEDLGADSLDAVIGLSEIEDRLGIEISDEELLSMKTVGAAAAHIAAAAGIESGTTVTAEDDPSDDA